MDLTGSIDIGSNAMRFAVGGINEKGELQVKKSGREAVSLGRSVFDNGKISEKTIALAVEAVRKFSDVIQSEGAKKFRAVGTSALREAENRDDFLSAVKKGAGIDIEAISGDEEARLIRLAVLNSIDLSNSEALLFDIGGGSGEISLLSKGKLLLSRSEKLGSVRLLKKISQGSTNQEKYSKLVSRFIKGFLDQLDADLLPQKIDLFVGTGGNIEALGVLRLKLFEKKNSKKLKFNELEQIVEILQSMSYEERMKKLDLREDRADVIVPASVVLLEVMRHANAEKVTIPNVGLREGVILDLLGVKKT